MAATWNQELIEELGTMIGNEGILGAANKGNGLSYSGWYAPGVNIHRSAFGGRNFEYFSEDGILNGKMAAAEIRGCRSKGVYCFVKHFAVWCPYCWRYGASWRFGNLLKEIRF